MGVAVGVEISITTGVPLLAVSHAQFALLYNTINKSEHNACVAVTGRNQIKHYSYHVLTTLCVFIYVIEPPRMLKVGL